jgi:hypothetical protein
VRRLGWKRRIYYLWMIEWTNICWLSMPVVVSEAIKKAKYFSKLRIWLRQR